MAVNFPNSPTDQQTFISSGRTYRFNGTSSIWEVVQGTTTCLLYTSDAADE